MKKILLQTSMVLCLFVLGCKQNELIKPEATHEVTFTVSDLLTDVQPFDKEGASTSSVGDTLRNYARYLYCRIYPDDGSPFITLIQSSESPVFGELKTKLAPGTYSVSFLASNQRLSLDQGTNSYNDFQMRRDELPYWEDLFALYNHRINVGEGNIKTSVSLQRVVGAIEVNLQDMIPAAVTKIGLDLLWDATSYNFGNQTFNRTASHKDFILTTAQKSQPNQKFFMHVLNTQPANNFEFRIQAYNASNVLTNERKIIIPQVYMNKKTVLSGSLFTPVPTDANFTITIDPVWSTGIPRNIGF